VSDTSIRHLVVVLGDQLDAASAAFDGFDPACDAVWMAEVAGEATHVWSHKARIALFLAAMRHFAADRRADGIAVHYRALGEHDAPSLAEALRLDLARLAPELVVLVEPGEWRVRRDLEQALAAAGVPADVRADRHFLCSHEEFAEHAGSRKQLRMEFFYRQMRRRHDVLMEGDEPAGGQWNYDADNRRAFGKGGPPPMPPPRRFAPDEITRGVLDAVEAHFPQHPGRLDLFDWPVTPAQARQALDDFVEHRLAAFGDVQDAMWTGRPWLYHSRLSAAMNLKLLDPREVIDAAESAWRRGAVPLNAAEGFIRQVLGWREYVRGIYWRFMPDYLERNELGAGEPLPAFYWTAGTSMVCLRETVGQTLDLGYAHHIQRLMVTGLYALLLGVDPKAVHEWYLAVYVDAVEWVELPNTLGMSQYADGGIMASKPYAATGKYIQRMSDYCRGCAYDPAQATGERACPFTTLYWDFLLRHEQRLRANPRMSLQVRNLDRLSAERREEIRRAAAAHRAAVTGAA
jgi:deoxyribodipyrimidine photolyase-related protein